MGNSKSHSKELNFTGSGELSVDDYVQAMMELLTKSDR